MPILTPEERFGQLVAGRYRLGVVLSTGGMGVLFRALDEATGVHVAVKMLKPVYALEPDRVARFLRETRIAAELRHANLVSVLEVWTDEVGVPFLIMELLEGRSLAQELDKRGVLPFDEALSMAIPIVRALAAAHAVGIIHRDIKPSNIFLCQDADGQVVPKLLDFGIAKRQSDDFETQTGLMLGTPGYMSPEQAQLGECGPATDVWGMGAVLYRCLTGRPPHASDSMPELLQKLVREPVPPLAVAGASKPGCATIDRALVRDPHRRYPSMEAFGRALAVAAGHKYVEGERTEHQTETTRAEPIEALRSPARSAPRRYRLRFALLSTGLLCMLLLVWALEPKSAVGDEPQATANQLAVHEGIARIATGSSPPLLMSREPPPEPQSAVLSTPGAAPSELVAAQPRRRARRTARRAVRVRTLAEPMIGKTVVPPAAIESEATTGLPVATEW
jgi:hypothetical protein